jgi:hypothetical protein
MFEAILFNKHIFRDYSKLVPSRWVSGSAGLKEFNGHWKISTDSGWPVRGILSPPPAYRSSFGAKRKSRTLGFRPGNFMGWISGPHRCLFWRRSKREAFSVLIPVAYPRGIFRIPNGLCSSGSLDGETSRSGFLDIYQGGICGRTV